MGTQVANGPAYPIWVLLNVAGRITALSNILTMRRDTFTTNDVC